MSAVVGINHGMSTAGVRNLTDARKSLKTVQNGNGGAFLNNDFEGS